MRTSILALACILAFMPLASAATVAPGQEIVATPTSMGQAIVGFHSKLPEIVDDHIVGLPVLEVEPRGNFIVVAATTLDSVRAAFAGFPDLRYIEDDQILHATVVPNDALYGNQYGPAMMGAEAAWDTVGFGDSSVKIAVIDSGVRQTHQDLAANHIGGYDHVNNDATPNDDCGHGTHVQGTVSAVTNNGIGVAGMSQASTLHYKALGNSIWGCTGSQSDINQAIYDAADAGARVISMSLGGGGYSQSGDDAVNYAWNAGALVVAASGNDSNSNSVSYPAAYSNAIAVGALTSSKVRASYSNGGAELEITAPGSDVESTYYSNDASYTSMSGTSMATPHVSGALGLALTCDNTLTNSQLRSLLQSTAEDLGAAGWDNLYGHGLMRIDSLINAIGTCGGGGGNNAPTSSFTYSANLLDVTFDGSGSSDSDGSIASYSWDFGDGNTGSGAAPSHSFAATGTYTVTLTVTDNEGATDASSQQVSVTDGASACTGGDPSVPEIADGATESISVASGTWTYRKVCVPSGATSLTVTMAGTGLDADLYTREGAAPTSSTYDCRPYTSGSNEECTSTPTAGWTYIGIHGYSGSGTVTLTADHNGGAPPANNAPTASFSHSTSDLLATFDASASSDPDGDSLSYSWDFGDGNTGIGVGPSHTYAAAGTYTVSLTVDDGNGGSDSTTTSVTVTDPAPPAGCTDNGDGVTIMDSGTTYSASVGSGQWAYGKICVASGQSLDVDMTGPGCGMFGCSFDADLYVKQGAQPTTSSYDCRPYLSGNDESCSFSNPAAGWWYVGVRGYSGSGTVNLVATTA